MPVWPVNLHAKRVGQNERIFILTTPPTFCSQNLNRKVESRGNKLLSKVDVTPPRISDSISGRRGYRKQQRKSHNLPLFHFKTCLLPPTSPLPSLCLLPPPLLCLLSLPLLQRPRDYVSSGISSFHFWMR